MIKPCVYCGCLFDGSVRQQFCSRSCSCQSQQGIPFAEVSGYCIGCGEFYLKIKHVKSKYCSTPCQLRNRDRVVKSDPSTYGVKARRFDWKVCRHCGRPMTNPSRKYCSSSCRHNANARHKRAIERFGLPIDRIDRFDLLEHFDFKCQKCSIVCVVAHASEKNLNMMTFDHIVPQKHGGKHVWNNVQLLCISCNMLKGDVLEGQMPLQLGFSGA